MNGNGGVLWKDLPGDLLTWCQILEMVCEVRERCMWPPCVRLACWIKLGINMRIREKISRIGAAAVCYVS